VNETTYQRNLIRKLTILFPGCVILKNDPQNSQGIPDLLILFGSQWAMLEVKASYNAPEQPNQDYYIEMYDEMSFAAFIHPQNEERVLDDLQSAFGTARQARIS